MKEKYWLIIHDKACFCSRATATKCGVFKSMQKLMLGI